MDTKEGKKNKQKEIKINQDTCCPKLLKDLN